VKKPETILKEYAIRLSEENLRYLSYRLETRMGSDLAEALDFLANTGEVDKWLSSAKTCTELYDMIDQVQASVKKELQKKESR
jgi:hypothetical protein